MEMQGNTPEKVRVVPSEGWKFWERSQGIHMKEVEDEYGLHPIVSEMDLGKQIEVNSRGEPYPIAPQQRLLLLSQSDILRPSEVAAFIQFALVYGTLQCTSVSSDAQVFEGAYEVVDGFQAQEGRKFHADEMHSLPIIQLSDNRGFISIDTSAGRSIARSSEQALGQEGVYRHAVPGDEEFTVLAVHADSAEKLIEILRKLYNINFEHRYFFKTEDVC